MKKTIIGLALFSLLAGTVAAAEMQPLSPRAEKQSQYMAGSRLSSCLATGESREDCIEEIKEKAMEVREDAEEEKEEMREKAEELRKEAIEEKGEMEDEAMETKKDAVEKRRELQDEFKSEMAEAETDEERAKVKEEFATKRDGLKEESKEKRDELKAERMDKVKELKDKRKVYLEKRLKNILRKYGAYQKRAHSIYDRIAFNIDKLKKAGVDVTVLEGYQEKGKALLVVVDTELTAAQAGVIAILSGNLEKDEIKKNLALIKENLAVAKKAMKEYFAGVRDIVKELRDNKVDEDEEGDEDEDESNDAKAQDHNATRLNKISS